MKKRMMLLIAPLALAGCNSTPELDNAGPAVSVTTSGGLYRVTDAPDTRTLKVLTAFGQGNELNVWRAADQYLAQHRPGCDQTDRIELSDGGYVKGIYLIKYRCADKAS